MHLETRILITGGAGFLGSHLCERLLTNGGNVICLDNFFTGAKRNIDHRFELIRHDVTFPLYIEVDQIYNLACPASPIHYQHDPVQTTKTSVHGAINMLGLARGTSAPRSGRRPCVIGVMYKGRHPDCDRCKPQGSLVANYLTVFLLEPPMF
jgi:UDP-glucuronate decarboxylase